MTTAAEVFTSAPTSRNSCDGPGRPAGRWSAWPPPADPTLCKMQAPRTGPGETQIEYPYTLRGIENALTDAVFRSIGGPAQVIKVVSGDQSRVIRRYEHGREMPVTS